MNESDESEWIDGWMVDEKEESVKRKERKRKKREKRAFLYFVSQLRKNDSYIQVGGSPPANRPVRDVLTYCRRAALSTNQSDIV